MNENRQLIFVYNADGGLFSTVADFAHKILSPATYQCRLCALTYGNFTINNDWKNFISRLPFEVKFVYKNEFLETYKTPLALPAVLIKKNGSIEPFLNNDDIENCKTLQEVKDIILLKLSKI